MQSAFLPWEAVDLKEDPVKYFTDVLLEVSQKCVPKSSKHPPKKSKPWYNEDCQRAKRERNRARYKLSKTITTENIQRHQQANAQTRRIYKTSMRDSFHVFVRSIGTSTPMAKIYNFMKRMKGKSANPPLYHLTVGGEKKYSKTEIATALAMQFQKTSSTANCDAGFLQQKEVKKLTALNFTSKNEEDYNRPFSMEELNHALYEAKDSSPGPDDIHYQMLKHLPEKHLEMLLNTMNKVWLKGMYPKSWSEATVIPIAKPGKDHSLPSSYRPMAMTSCISKTMKRMVNN